MFSVLLGIGARPDRQLDGTPYLWGLGNPKIGERGVTQALLELDGHLIREGQVIPGWPGRPGRRRPAGLAVAGRDFERPITDVLGTTVIRPDRGDENPRFGKSGGVRQWIESVFDTLKGRPGLEHHGGRTLAGVNARVAALQL
ncbi:hypothetical protein G6034_12815 [Arthrobacter sp. AETb3-4]|uniref:Uncharacterized protein n=1 Tax=Arthrobacter wenxiniae TaxID=2713570 RepID=A0A7Y7IHZ0_9MICC|nr:hypothetical protein [Arthrobacter wenxiniae]